MREITQVEQFNLRGIRVIEKVRSIINSGQAERILIEDSQGSIMFKISPNKNFMQPTLDIVRGIIKTIRECKIVVLKNQMQLFS